MDRREFLKGAAIASVGPLAAEAGGRSISPESDVEKVYILAMRHLDIGFTDTERNVLLTYFDQYIPRAMDLAAELRRAQGEERYVWTLASWMVYQYLEQASTAQRARMESAISAGDIAWHAMPFTWQSEMLDESLFASALRISSALDKRFGRRTIAGKFADVPGHTRGLIAPLAAAGITFLDIGDNPGCRVRDVPFLPANGTAGADVAGAEPLEPHCHLFNWRNPAGEQVMTLYHKLGYGGTVAVPGTNLAVSVRVRMDNSGPHTASEVKTYYAALQKRFPRARIVATDLTTIARALEPVRGRLPVLTEEIGDTWIYGPPSDPGKVARYRGLCRLRREWLSAGRIRSGDAVDLALTSLLILMPEHNWGLATGAYLKDHADYTPTQVREARIVRPEFQKVDDEWTAKRRNVDIAVLTLPRALRQEARARLATLRPASPRKENLRTLDPAAGFTTPDFLVALDPRRGAIIKLTDRKSVRAWASPAHPPALFRYETFSSADFTRFNAQYNTERFADNDFGKPGMNRFPVASRDWLPVLRQCVSAEESGGYRVVMDLAIENPEPALADFPGCPRRLTVERLFPSNERAVRIRLQCFGKRANRLAEAMWLSFSPEAPDRNGWTLEKMNQPISPLDVIRNGNRKMHAVTKSVWYKDRTGSFTLETLDAPVVAPGERSLLNFNNDQRDMRQGVHVNLYNNL